MVFTPTKSIHLVTRWNLVNWIASLSELPTKLSSFTITYVIAQILDFWAYSLIELMLYHKGINNDQLFIRSTESLQNSFRLSCPLVFISLRHQYLLNYHFFCVASFTCCAASNFRFTFLPEQLLGQTCDLCPSRVRQSMESNSDQVSTINES